MFITMNLDDGDNLLAKGFPISAATTFRKNMPAAELALTLGTQSKRAMRVMHVDLDYIYDPIHSNRRKILVCCSIGSRRRESPPSFFRLLLMTMPRCRQSALFSNRHLPSRLICSTGQLASRLANRISSFRLVAADRLRTSIGHPLHSHKSSPLTAALVLVIPD